MNEFHGKSIITRPSYDDIQRGCYSLAIDVIKSSIKIDFIVGLSRGGLIPAVELSNILDIPMKPIAYSAKSGNGNNKNHDNKLPLIFGELNSGTGELPDFPTLLIVDDICDSGYTLKEIKEHYTNEGHKIYTAALYSKSLAVIVPDFVWQKIGLNSPWIVFPWEKT